MDNSHTPEQCSLSILHLSTHVIDVIRAIKPAVSNEELMAALDPNDNVIIAGLCALLLANGMTEEHATTHLTTAIAEYRAAH
jgi:hypothetical protein